MRIIAFVEPPFRFEPPGEFALLTQMSPSDRFIVVNEREVFFGSNFCPPSIPLLLFRTCSIHRLARSSMRLKLKFLKRVLFLSWISVANRWTEVGYVFISFDSSIFRDLSNNYFLNMRLNCWKESCCYIWNNFEREDVSIYLIVTHRVTLKDLRKQFASLKCDKLINRGKKRILIFLMWYQSRQQIKFRTRVQNIRNTIDTRWGKNESV